MNLETENALPRGWVQTTLGAIRLDRSQNVEPDDWANEKFELYSVPSYDVGKPDIVYGREIGSNKRTVEIDTILLCKINPRINRVWIVGNFSPYRKIASTEWIQFERIDGIDSRYLRYFMQQEAFRDFLAANASGIGGSLMRIKPQVFKQYPILLPPTSEQHHIVEEIEKQFSRLDVGVKGLKRTEINLLRFRDLTLKAAVEGRLVQTEAELARLEKRSYESAEQLLTSILSRRREKWEASQLALMEAQHKTPKNDTWKAKYKEPEPPEITNLPTLPEGWIWVTLPQLGELNRGKSKHRPRNDPKLYGGEYPFIQTGDVKQSDGYIRAHTQTYNEEGLAQSRLWPAGTLCITIAANIAETGILTYPACFPDSIVGFIPEDNMVSVRYVELFIRTAKQQLNAYAPATTQKNINLEILSNVAIPLPPFAEQQRIVAEADRRLSVIDKLEDVVRVNLKRAETLRQTILQYAFKGKLVAQNPDDEPANILLEHILKEKLLSEQQAKSKYRVERNRMIRDKIKAKRTKSTKRRPLLDVLLEAKRPLAPEDLFSEAGFDIDNIEEAIDDFYRELGDEIESKRIKEVRPNNADVYLEAAA